MSQYEILDKEKHRHLRIKTGYGAALGDAVMYVMTYPMEFRNIQGCYPILFTKDPNTGGFFAAAVFGFEADQNLFLQNDGWDASYVPDMVQRQPFLMATGGEGKNANPVVSLDLDHPRVAQDEGEALFDAEGRVILDEGGFAEWLNWLQIAQDQPGIAWTTDRQEALDLFIQNEAAYLAGEKWMENELQESLGVDKLRVAPLPAGPKGEAGPFLVVIGALLNPASDPEERALALEFARYIAGPESQTLLMKQANYIPANVNVDITDHPVIDGFMEQARTAIVIPNDRVDQILFMYYSDYDIYQEVLVGGQEPAEAVDIFTKLVNETHNATRIPGQE